MAKFTRNDLRKYTKPTKQINFRVDADFPYKGSKAKEILKDVFHILIMQIKLDHPEDWEAVFAQHESLTDLADLILCIDIMVINDGLD